MLVSLHRPKRSRLPLHHVQPRTRHARRPVDTPQPSPSPSPSPPSAYTAASIHINDSIAPIT
eukprot:673536-Rhodomonas_salina.1